MPRPTAEQLANAPTYRLILGVGEEGPILSEPVRACREPDGFWTNQGGERVTLEQFLESGVRCDDAGNPMIMLQAPLSIQRQAIKRHVELTPGAEVAAHLDDLDVLRQAFAENPSEIEDTDTRADIHMFDALAAAPRDNVMPQNALGQEPVEPEERGPDPVIRLIERDTGIGEENWIRVSNIPSYQVEAFRAMARQMLAPVLGNIVSMEDLRFIAIPKEEAERAGAIRRWIRGAGESRTLQPFSHPAMPGYRTNEPIVAERAGVTLLTFEDFGAAYAYAWQSDPDQTLELVPKADEEDPGMDDPGPFPFRI